MRTHNPKKYYALAVLCPVASVALLIALCQLTEGDEEGL